MPTVLSAPDGGLGGYTTFSSTQLDAVKLAGKRGGVPAASYLLLSVLVGQLAAALGGTFARVQGWGGFAVVNTVILVFVGGALGAMLREFSMLMVPNLSDNFPLDILVANLVAAFLLGLVTALHRRQIVSEDAEMLVGSGIAGGLSTFSSLVYGRSRLDVGLDGKRRRRASLCRDQSGAGLHRSHCRTEAQRTRLSMNGFPAGEETLVFIGYMRVSKADDVFEDVPRCPPCING
jgi:protein CrcB